CTRRRRVAATREARFVQPRLPSPPLCPRRSHTQREAAGKLAKMRFLSLSHPLQHCKFFRQLSEKGVDSERCHRVQAQQCSRSRAEWASAEITRRVILRIFVLRATADPKPKMEERHDQKNCDRSSPGRRGGGWLRNSRNAFRRRRYRFHSAGVPEERFRE